MQYNVSKYHNACVGTESLRVCFGCLCTCLGVYKLYSGICEWMLNKGCKFSFAIRGNQHVQQMLLQVSESGRGAILIVH